MDCTIEFKEHCRIWRNADKAAVGEMGVTASIIFANLFRFSG
jgi:hypothetical protein